MKLKINKACDLSSISVLPPHTRRSSLAPSGPQPSQLRSQLSQQSFSQGISSQHALFSQISQNSLDEVVTTDQRFCSQERENTGKKLSCLPSTNFTREDSQMPISRPSTNLIRKWNSASAPEHRLEGIRQKLISEDTSLKLMNKGQEDIKASLDGGMKAISEQLNMDIYRDKLQQIFLVLSALPEQTEASLLKLRNELCNTFTDEIKLLSSIACNVKTLSQKGPVATAILPKSTSCCASPQSKPQAVKNQAVPPKVYEQPTQSPKVESGDWKSVKMKQSTIRERATCKEKKRKGVSSVEQETYGILIESDEEINGGFSCLLDCNETDRWNSNSNSLKVNYTNLLQEFNKPVECILKLLKKMIYHGLLRADG
ncbi:protein PAIR1-like isoform X9 [Durio zibethinus]|uniref:Protein PAIR1-like isoform X9 n=1 Tax=Durio zibethinus TaxID=66656 RepID=A0A6P5ZX40_DURZI|nr:protein PAIR1-like isoform X9 [Durio zibethinus]